MSAQRTDSARQVGARIAAAFALVALVCAASAAWSAPQEIWVTAGSQSVLVPPGAVQRAAVADPAIADVNVFKPTEVIVTGKIPGTTSITLWLEGVSAPRRYDVQVAAPELGTPAAMGSQVQIDTRIVELSRRAMREAGINITRVSDNTVVSVSPPGTISGLSSDGMGGFLVDSASGFLPISQAFNLVGGHGGEGLLVTLSVLEQNGLAHTLAEPSLVAMSGHTASFLAGGEFPIPVVQGGGGSNSITIEFKPFGIRLMVTPTVLSNDRIALKVAPEVSEIDFSSGVETSGVTVPGLVTRRADTTIELGSGESFAISGLISQGLTATVDKVPVLGDIPILGGLFKSTRFDRQDRELLMIVSPTLVRPLAAGAPELPLPGEEYRHYNPSLGELQLFERGDFDPEGAGFNR